MAMVKVLCRHKSTVRGVPATGNKKKKREKTLLFVDAINSDFTARRVWRMEAHGRAMIVG